MARGSWFGKEPNPKWIHYPYMDHAGLPATLVINKATNPQANDDDLAPIPEFAFQIYSTVPLDPDHTALCEYLSRHMDSWPKPSFEIYAPQPDAFACVEHQRHEIRHRKTVKPGDEFFPGIAKVTTSYQELPQGLLLVITSYTYRMAHRSKHYEEGTGPLRVNFNRCFPSRAEVDLQSRYFDPPPYDDESELCFEREEIVITKCQNIFEMQMNLKTNFSRSRTLSGFDYGLEEDEGQPFSTAQPLSAELIQLLRNRSNILSPEDFRTESYTQGTVTVTTNPAVLEPDLQYIVYISFPHSGTDLAQVAQAFTFEFVMNRPHGNKSIRLIFNTPPNPSPGSIMASYHDLISSHPELTIGALQTTTRDPGHNTKNTRVFPLTRCQSERYSEKREPYRTFIVILDRPDFLTAPGVLFLLSDGNQIKNEHDEEDDIYVDYKESQIWRSVGIPAVAQRLTWGG